MMFDDTTALNLLVALVIVMLVAILIAAKTVVARLDTIAANVKQGDSEVAVSSSGF